MEASMNIEQAKCIPIPEILRKLNIRPEKEDDYSCWYHSPIRQEKTASFRVRKRQNDWRDFGIDCWGDTLDLVCAILEYHGESHTPSDGLRWLSNMIIGMNWLPVIPDPQEHPEDPTLIVKNVTKIKKVALANYMRERGIEKTTYEPYVREIYVHSKRTGKNFFAIGMKNEKSGYELRNPNFKGCVGKKSVTLIRSTSNAKLEIHFFEGMMDFFTAIEMNAGKPLNGDSIVLHSVSNINAAYSFFHGFGYKVAYTWLDNDDAGKKATNTLREYFQREDGLRHVTLNRVYKSHKDLNDWYHAKKMKLEIK